MYPFGINHYVNFQRIYKSSLTLTKYFCALQECAGLNGTLLAAAAFQPGNPLVLHAIDGDGVPLTLGLGNAISLFGCQVKTSG